MAKTVKSEVADIAIRTAAIMAAEAERQAIVAFVRENDHEIPAPRGIVKLVAVYLSEAISRRDHIKGKGR